MFLLGKLFQAKAAPGKVWSYEWAEEAKGSKFIPKPPAYTLAPCAMGMPAWAEKMQGMLLPDPGLDKVLGDVWARPRKPLWNSAWADGGDSGSHQPHMDPDILGSRQAACSV